MVAAEGLSLDPDPVSVISRVDVGLPVASAFRPSARLDEGRGERSGAHLPPRSGHEFAFTARLPVRIPWVWTAG